MKSTNTNNKRNRFNEDDDKRLLQLTQKYQENWNKIGKIMKRSKRACKERYLHYIIPQHSTWQWTTEEKMQLIYLKSQLDLSWSDINKVFPSRGPKTIKNQWYYLSKKPAVQMMIEQFKNKKTRPYHKHCNKNSDNMNSSINFSDFFEASDFDIF